MKNHHSYLIPILGAISLLLAACGGAEVTPVPQVTPEPHALVIAEGTIRPVKASNLSFQARGLVELVNVEIGDRVREGEVLVRLANAGAAEAQEVSAQHTYDRLLRNESGDRARLWQAYMDAQKARAKAETKWEDLNQDNIEDRIEDAEEEVEDRQLDLKQEQEDFEKYKDLSEEDDKRTNAEDDLETAQENLNESIRDLESILRERDEVRAAYDAALASEAEARYQYEISLDGPNSEQLALAEAQLEAARDALDAYVITAPFDGIVAQVDVSEGEQIGPETRAVSVADTSSWIVETSDITELEVVDLYVGQEAVITLDALPGVLLEGSVIEIGQAAFVQGGDVMYTVRMWVDQVDPRVRWGMTTEVTFLEGEK